MINKIGNKKAASDMVVVLIMIVIFSSVGLVVFKGIGNSSKDAGATVSVLMDDSIGYSEVTSSGGEYGKIYF